MLVINTLARHIAALREAHRLTGLVLANNPAFAALQVARPAQDAVEVSRLEAVLQADHVYLAYRDLEAAIAEIQPPHAPDAGSDSRSLPQQVSLIAPDTQPENREAEVRPAETEAPAKSAAAGDEPTLAERLQKALDATAVAESPKLLLSQAAALRDEAKVSIVFRDAAASLPRSASGPSTLPRLLPTA